MVIDANMVTAQAWLMPTAQEKLLSNHLLMQMRPERIGRRLRVLREALGLKPSEISDALGIERTYWSRFENGKRPLTEITAALLVERFDVTMDYLILGKWEKLPMDLATKMRAAEKNIDDQGFPQ